MNEWLGGDREDWIAAMECAREWVANNSDPDYLRRRYRAQHDQVLAGLTQLIASIPPAAELRQQRRAAGLPNR